MKYSDILKKVALVIVSIFFFFIVVEISLRAISRIFSKRPSITETAKSDNSFNILCFGDSFTYGIGVDTADTYPKQLENFLNQSDVNRRFRVYNLAIPGCNSSQVLEYFGSILNRYQNPDLVIILTGANDSWNFAHSNICKFLNKANKFEANKIKTKIFFSELKVYKMLKLIWLNLKGMRAESEVDAFSQIAKYEKIDKGLLKQLLEYNLNEIVKLAKSNNIKIILQNYPRGDLYAEKITHQVALRNNVPFFDNSAIFGEKLKVARFKDLFLYDNSHPNKEGCKMMAYGLYKIILENFFTKR